MPITNDIMIIKEKQTKILESREQFLKEFETHLKQEKVANIVTNTPEETKNDKSQ